MRRWVLALGVCGAIGCGLDVVGALDVSPAPAADGGFESGAMLPDLDASGDAAADGGIDPDGGVDAARDAEAMRPDAGVAFVPSHIYPDYTLTAPAVVIDTDTRIDTTARTISVNGATPVPLAAMVQSGTFAVWSVGALTINSGVTLEVVGTRPLVVVSAATVDVAGVVAVYGDRKRPGPGGALPSSGPGKGGDGSRPTLTIASGGGGAGHATAGTAGAVQGAAVGGTAGPITNADGALLIGGAGGGNGGGFASNMCTDATRGKGGFGGGALQISAVGKITIAGSGVIDAGGGGGLGGCKNDPGNGNHITGGGGGGAGGQVVLESVAGVDIQTGAEIAAGGGGGGEGGNSSDNGADGESGLSQPARIASGGTGNGGGAGAAGGYGVLGSASAPGAALAVLGTTAASGGGGGAVGQVFLGVRTPSTRNVAGSIAALRSDFAF